MTSIFKSYSAPSNSALGITLNNVFFGSVPINKVGSISIKDQSALLTCVLVGTVPGGITEE